MTQFDEPTLDCLTDEVLFRLTTANCAPEEFRRCEEHLSECARCREVIEKQSIDEQWLEYFLPALRNSVEQKTEYNRPFQQKQVDLEAVLKLLGPSDHPHMLGRIGVYEIVGVVGSGGMGVVFKAFDTALHRFVAIKIMQPHLAVSGTARQRFEREGRAAASVINDSVLPIYSVAEWKNVPYLVMQYSSGINLQQRLEKEGPLRLIEILRVALQTVRGLAAAHNQGLVHRDIKPSNVLLDNGIDRALLTDFGLARAIDDGSVTRTGQIAGTPQYMSPEQIRGDKVDARSDLFSLGATLYAMCTGRAPFRGDSTFSVMHRLIHDQPRPIQDINPDIPDWLCQIVNRLLAKEPSERFQTADELANLFEACLAHLQQPMSIELPDELRAKPRSLTMHLPPMLIRFLGLGGFVVALIYFGLIFLQEGNKGTLRIESTANNVAVRVLQGQDIAKELTVSKDGATIRIAAGNYVVELADMNSDRLVLNNGVVILERGEIEIIKITETSPKKETSSPDHHDDSAVFPKVYFIGDFISEPLFRVSLTGAEEDSVIESTNADVTLLAKNLIREIEQACGTCTMIEFIPSELAIIVEHEANGHQKLKDFLEAKIKNHQRTIHFAVMRVAKEELLPEHRDMFSKWNVPSRSFSETEHSEIASASSQQPRHTASIKATPGVPIILQPGQLGIRTILARHLPAAKDEPEQIQIRLDFESSPDRRHSTTSTVVYDKSNTGHHVYQSTKSDSFWIIIPSNRNGLYDWIPRDSLLVKPTDARANAASFPGTPQNQIDYRRQQFLIIYLQLKIDMLLQDIGKDKFPFSTLAKLQQELESTKTLISTSNGELWLKKNELEHAERRLAKGQSTKAEIDQLRIRLKSMEQTLATQPGLKTIDKLQGVWNVDQESRDINGSLLTQRFQAKITGRRLEITSVETNETNSFDLSFLEPSNPQQLDVLQVLNEEEWLKRISDQSGSHTTLSNPVSQTLFPSIFEFNGTTARLCFQEKANEKRPSEFNCNDGKVLWTFTRPRNNRSPYR